MRQSCLAVFLVISLAAACRQSAPGASVSDAPAAEFLLASGDSVYWINSDSSGISLRGAPLDLARISGRFVEFYVVDDDRSFPDADLIGQGVYRRDLLSGDSIRVFTDSLIPALASEYAKANPAERPLDEGEEPYEDPSLIATATLELGEAHGQFLSYSLHTDVERHDKPLWHASRRGVLHLGSGRPATLADVAGARAPAILKEVGRPLDASSFSIVTVDGTPAVAFAEPGTGVGRAGNIGAVSTVSIAEAPWWSDAAKSLPTTSAGGSRKIWSRGAISVVVRYDEQGTAKLAIRDSTSREWAVGLVSAPAKRIYWLDSPRIDDETRAALVQAFNEAAAYDGESLVATKALPHLHLAARIR